MELHTVGSGGGYTEADVKALALILSGWAFVTESDTLYTDDGGSPATVGQFLYKARWHEPFATIKHMGVTRTNTGKATGIAVLRWLAMRPQTAEHLAFKMIKHFITDRPTPAMVEPLKVAYLKSGGNLKSMALAMLSLKSAWKLPLAKYRSPYEAIVAQYRSMRTRHTNYAVDANQSDASNYQTTRWNLVFLNQKPWECLDPDGWDDDSAEWLNTDAVRVGIAAAYESVSTCPGQRRRAGPVADPADVQGRCRGAREVDPRVQSLGTDDCRDQCRAGREKGPRGPVRVA
jgi:uncharacterized protein (DUF1800 family)